jgi:prepilin-type N-terminal cleavage/methylation domain-containing protein
MNGSKSSGSSKAGFTLLEIIVAMTIIGLGVVTLLEIFSLGTRLGGRSIARTEALSYGRQVMDEFLARRTWHDGTEQGKLHGTSRWKLEVRPVRDSLSGPRLASEWELKEVALEMFVTDAGRERQLELNTMRLVKKAKP